MLQFTVPKAHSVERAEFLRQRIVDLDGGDVEMVALADRDAFFAERITLDSEFAIDLSPIRSLLQEEKARADERRRSEAHALEVRAFLIAESRRMARSAA